LWKAVPYPYTVWEEGVSVSRSSGVWDKRSGYVTSIATDDVVCSSSGGIARRSFTILYIIIALQQNENIVCEGTVENFRSALQHRPPIGALSLSRRAKAWISNAICRGLHVYNGLRIRIMVLDVTFNNISWRLLYPEKTTDLPQVTD
jgi:hypothetical protein